ncbi:MAG: HD domain-containing phosphohydrolase [bacterium]
MAAKDKEKKERIPVVVGDPLSQDIFSMDGSLLLASAGTIVTREMVIRLANWIVEEEPRLAGEREKKLPPSSTREVVLKKLDFDQIVSDKTRTELEKGVNDFFGRVGSSDKKVDMKRLEDSVARMIDETPDNPDVPMRLFELKRQAEVIYNHSVECGIMASFVAAALNYPTHEVNSFALSMMLHDVGFLALPTHLLEMKQQPFGDDLVQIRQHPRHGWDMLKKVSGVELLTMMIAIGHHVYGDGTGYPDEINFNDLPRLVHLAQVIDNFESLTSSLSYRPAYTMHDAVKLLLSQRNKYQPWALENFVRVVGIFPISTFVKLNTGEVGVVVRNNPGNLFLPEVKLVMDPLEKLYSEEIIVNLVDEPVRKITKVVEKV